MPGGQGKVFRQGLCDPSRPVTEKRILNKIILIIGVISAVVTGYLVFQRLEEANDMIAAQSYLTYSEEAGDEVLFSGEEITQSVLGTIAIPNGHDVFGLETRLIEDTAVNRNWLEGRRINTTIPRGRVLTYDLFEELPEQRLDMKVSEGMRAVSISVNSSTSLNNQIVPGNRIDILGVLDEIQNPEAIVLLEDVRVIGVGRINSFEEYQRRTPSYSTITIELTPEQGVQLTTDRQRVQGDFIVMLRNQCETSQPSESCA